MKTKRHKIVSVAERDLHAKEDAADHLDIVSELGCELKQPIPKGDAFIEWIANEDVQVACVAALLSRGFTWEEIRVGLFDLTRWRWLPSVEQLQLTQQQRR
jgi:hypothetical protein